VLRVHRVVHDRGIEPQAITILLAVVESGLEGVSPGAMAAASATAAAAPATRLAIHLLVVLVVSRRTGFALLARSARLLIALRPGFARAPWWTAAAPRRLTVRPGRAVRVVLVGLGLVLFVRSPGGRLRGLHGQRIGRTQRGCIVVIELVLALEASQLVDADVELVGDPRIGASLPYPQPNLVKLGSERRLASQGLFGRR
jgi:hypothetical protein